MSAPRIPEPTPLPSGDTRVRLFGEFLVEQGAIEPDDLDAALTLMQATNATIGELAVAHGLMSQRQADRIAAMQTRIDANWGDIAVALDRGGLSRAVVERLAWEQTTVNLRIGDALVEIGALSNTELDAWRDRYALQRGATAATGAWPLPYGEYDAVRLAVEGLPRVTRRLLRTAAIVSAPHVWSRASSESLLPHRACASLEGGFALDVALCVPLSLGETIARRLHPTRADHPDRVDEALADLVGVLAHYVARSLDDGPDPAAAPCTVAATHVDAMPERGLAFAVSVGRGHALLVVDPH